MKQSDIDGVVIFHVLFVLLSFVLGNMEILGILFGLYIMVYFLNFWLVDKYDNWKNKKK